MSAFKERVIEIIKAVPYGTVVSYGQVAAMAGVPRAARQVGWILNRSEGHESIPWWRVINNAGVISIKGGKYNDKLKQKELLEQEGIKVSKNFELTIEQYRFRPTAEQLRSFSLPSSYVDLLLEKYEQL